MRRSLVIQLTLVPMLAVAAVAAADPGPETLAPPGMTEPELLPPGLTPTYDDCHADPDNLRCDPVYFVEDECTADEIDCTYVVNGVIRGGFGHYFRPSGG